MALTTSVTETRFSHERPVEDPVVAVVEWIREVLFSPAYHSWGSHRILAG